MNHLRAISNVRTLLLAALLVVPASVILINSHKIFAAGACTAPSTDYGTVTDAVTVPATGTYRIWTRMSAPDTTNNNYMLQIDGASCYTVGGSSIPVYASGATTFFTSGSTNWTSKTTTGTQIDVSLSSGSHSFELIGNAPGVVVDRLVLTQDTSCVPTGTGDNCSNPPDTTPPVVSITSPASGTSLSATTTVTASASDDVAVSKVEFYVDGTLKGTDTSLPYTYSLDPSTLTIGSHSLTAKAYDAANNTATSSTVAVTVADKTAPAVTLTAPTAGSTVSGTTTLSANASDNVGVSKVEFYVDGTLKGTDTTGSSGTYSVSLDTSSLSNASHSVTAKAYDAAANTTTSSAVSTTVNNPATPPTDTTPPTVSMTAPAASSTISGTSTLSATASDTSGIASVAFYVDGTLKNTDTTAPYSYAFDTTTLSNGSHAFKAVAIDNSSNKNTATSSTVTATVNNVTYLSADINKDGHVNLQDFSLLAADYGKTTASLKTARSDVNGDGIVNLQDFSLLAAKYGQ